MCEHWKGQRKTVWCLSSLCQLPCLVGPHWAQTRVTWIIFFYSFPRHHLPTCIFLLIFHEFPYFPSLFSIPDISMVSHYLLVAAARRNSLLRIHGMLRSLKYICFNQFTIFESHRGNSCQKIINQSNMGKLPDTGNLLSHKSCFEIIFRHLLEVEIFFYIQVKMCT